MEFKSVLEEKTKAADRLVGRQVEQYLQAHHEAYIDTILDAMKYSVMAGGKRLRPLLMFETFEMLAKGDIRKERSHALEVFMTAMEMIHTYSLVHDDLPAMDNDSFRRGKETTWKAYGEAMGVLAGDALMNAAFEMIFQLMMESSQLSWESQKAIADCGLILSKKACLAGMLGGQVADVEAEKKSIAMTMERILYIHENKTAALIEASMSIGAVLAGAEPGTVEKIAEIASGVGIAFQIQDDLLDVEGNSAELGKPVGSDAESGKETYVTLKGLDESHKDVKVLSEAAVRELETLAVKADSLELEFLKELILYLIYRKK